MTICNDRRGLDKLIHFLVGALLCLLVGTLVAFAPPHLPWIALSAAMAAVIVAAVWREVTNSRQTGNHFCVWDCLWTIAGGIAVCWLPWLTAYLLAVNH